MPFEKVCGPLIGTGYNSVYCPRKGETLDERTDETRPIAILAPMFRGTLR